MKSRCGSSLILMLSVTGLTVLAQTPMAWEIRDGGFTRKFTVAMDEVAVRGPDGRFESRKVTPATSMAEIRQRAENERRRSGRETRLVLYEEGVERNLYTRRVLTSKVLIQVEPDVDVERLAGSAGATRVERVDFAPGCYILEAPDLDGALTLTEQLRGQPGVLAADPLLARRQAKKWIPNDTLFTQQWHLLNKGQGGGTPGIDVNITNVWDTYRGAGILIGIVDDGLQTTHTDLVQNVNTTLDWDFNGNDGNPDPDVNADYHGTACAGVAAARGNNGRGVCGAAPEATLVGYRLIGGDTDDAMEAAALATNNHLVHIKSNSWGPNDDGRTLEAPGPLTVAALSNGVTTGRGGRGTVYVWAGGNGLDANDNANYDGYANSIYTIAIAALTDYGTQAWYSEPGACLVATAPSSGGATDIITTDLMGNYGYNYAGAPDELSDVNYTKTFGGTSSATPLAAGVLALLLQANTNLGWRDVQEILIRTATKVQPSDSDWKTNSAGFSFNHKFGAGLVNARAALNVALTWTNLGPRSVARLSETNLNLVIPDNNVTGIVRTFNFGSTNLRVEHVTVTLDIRHTYRGNLAITLTSPSGMESRLAEQHADSGDHYSSWTFSSVRHWGESAQGVWSLRIADRVALNIGTLRWVRVELHGVPIAAAANQPPTLAPIGSKTIAVGNLLSFSVSASDPVDGDLVRLWATNVPAWATFPGVTNAASATSTFSGVPTSTGLYMVSFFAADKDGTNQEAVAISVTEAVASTNYFVDFEGAGETKAAYASNNVTLSGISWSLSEALIGTSASDRFFGLRAARLRTNGVMAMLADFAGGATNISFYHARYGTDGPSTLALDYSVNGGASWINAGTVTVSSTTLTLYSTNVNVTGNIRIRIRLTSTGSPRANVDNIQISAGVGGAPTPTPPGLEPIPGQSIPVGQTLAFEIAATPTDGDPVSLWAVNLPSGATFASDGPYGLFTWTNAGPVGVYTSIVYAADKDGTNSQPVLITVTPLGGAEPLALDGYRLKQYNSAITYTFPTGIVVQPGGYVIIARNVTRSQFEAAWGVTLGPNVVFINSGNRIPMINGDETYELLDAGGNLVDGTTPSTLNPLNNSIQRTNLSLAASQVEAWKASSWSSATPGYGAAGNGTAGLRISEYSDAAGFTNEFVELYYDALVSTDTDGDGLPDEWESEYFGNATNALPHVDSDGDGASNHDEYVAGTHPQSASSVFRIDQMRFDPAAQVEFFGRTGRVYRLEYATSLAPNIQWQTIAENVPGSNAVQVITDSTTDSVRFYRLGVRKP